MENVWCNRSFSSALKVRHAGAGAPAGAGGIGAAAAGVGLPTPLAGAGGLAPGTETGAAITISRGTSFAAGGFPMRRGDPVSSMTVGRQMSVLHDGTMVIHSSTTTYGRGAGGMGLGGGSSFSMRPGPSFAATGHGLAPSPAGHAGAPPVTASPAGGLPPAPAGGAGTRGGGYKAIPDFGAAGKTAPVAGAATTAGVGAPAVEAAAVSAYTGTTAGAVEGTGAPGETTTAILSADSSGASDDSSDSDSDTYRSGPTPLDAAAAEQHPLPVMLMAEPGSRTPHGGFRMIRKAESAPIVVHETPLLSPSDVESADDTSEGRTGSRVSTTTGVRGTDTTADGTSSAGPSLEPASTRSVAASVPRFASPLSPPSQARLLPPTTLLPLAAPLAGAAGTVAAPGEGSVATGTTSSLPELRSQQVRLAARKVALRDALEGFRSGSSHVCAAVGGLHGTLRKPSCAVDQGAAITVPSLPAAPELSCPLVASLDAPRPHTPRRRWCLTSRSARPPATSLLPVWGRCLTPRCTHTRVRLRWRAASGSTTDP